MDAIPKQIIDAKIQQGNMLFKIKWEPQQPLIQPLEYIKEENQSEDFNVLKNEFSNISRSDQKQILQFEHCREKSNEKGKLGSIEDGDQPLRIKKIRRLERHLEFIIEWKEKNGYKPLDSIVTNDQLKINHKNFLFEFYENRLVFEEYQQFNYFTNF